MLMNPAGYALLKQFEGCSLVAYKDQAGVLTQGYGHTGDGVTPNDPWTQVNADFYLAQDVNWTEDALLDMIEPELTDNQFSALVCLAYNIGTGAFAGSSALWCVNNGDLADVPAHIKLWNKAKINGVLHVSRGLLRRRAAECVLWGTL